MTSTNLPQPKTAGYVGSSRSAHSAVASGWPRLDAAEGAERRQAALLYGGALLLLAIVLRLAGMAAENFWHDEVTMLNIGLGGWQKTLEEFTRIGRPPVFGLIASVWSDLFGTGEVVSRLPSFFAAVLSVAVTFRLGSMLFNQRVGALAALVMTLAEFHIYYAQTYRYYAVYVLFVILSFFYFYMMLRRPRWSYGFLYVLFTALALYTHAHGMFTIASQGLFFLFMLATQREWRNRTMLARWLAIGVVLFVVAFPGMWEYMLSGLLGPALSDTTAEEAVGDVGVGWLQEPTVGSIGRALIRFIVFEWHYVNPVSILAAIFVFGLGIYLYWRRVGAAQWHTNARRLPATVTHELRGRVPALTFSITWLVGMLLIPWALSFVVVPMYYDRYVLGASPAFYLLLAFAVFAIRSVVPPRVVALAFTALLIPGLVIYYTQPDNEQWRDLTAYVDSQVQPGDAVVAITSDVHLGQTLEAFNWYYPGSADCELYENELDDPETVDGLTDCIAGHDRVWLVALRWEGDFDHLADQGLSGNLSEFFATYDAGQWQLAESMEGKPFYLLGLYRYDKIRTDA